MEKHNYSLYKRGRFFSVRFTLDGREIRKSTKETIESHAHQKALVIIRNHKDERPGNQLRLAQLCVQYLEFKKDRISTWRDEQSMFIVMLAFFGASTPIGDIRKQRVLELIQWLQGRKVGRERTISQARINRYLTTLRSLYNWAMDNELFEGVNPVGKRMRFTEVARDRYFTSIEVDRLWSAAEEVARTGKTSMQKRFLHIFAVGLFTGMRLSEILTLKWQDYREAGFFQLQLTKNKTKRYVPIRPELLDMLNAIRGDSEYVIGMVSRDPSAIRKVWADVKARAGIEPSARFHDVRHTFCTQISRAGVDAKTAMAITGHKHLVSFQRYLHSAGELKQEAVQRLELPPAFLKQIEQGAKLIGTEK
jgi:integrase